MLWACSAGRVRRVIATVSTRLSPSIGPHVASTGSALTASEQPVENPSTSMHSGLPTPSSASAV
jgi:hypothetical protein